MSKIFITENLKLACALTACGFEVDLQQSENVVDEQGKSKLVLAIKTPANGVDAGELAEVFLNQKESEVDAIIERHGLTREEVCALFFDGARAGLHNRSQLLFCASRSAPMKAMSVGGGRTLIYRDGTPKEELKRLVNR